MRCQVQEAAIRKEMKLPNDRRLDLCNHPPMCTIRGESLIVIPSFRNPPFVEPLSDHDDNVALMT